LASCGPTATTGNAAGDVDTLILNEDEGRIGNDPAADNAAEPVTENALVPAASNAF